MPISPITNSDLISWTPVLSINSRTSSFDIYLFTDESKVKFSTQNNFDAQLIQLLVSKFSNSTATFTPILIFSDGLSQMVLKLFIDNQTFLSRRDQLHKSINVTSEFETLDQVMDLEFQLNFVLRNTLHDIKSPLSSLMLSMEMLEETCCTDDQIHLKLQKLIGKFHDYCNWMPEQFSKLILAEKFCYAFNWNCSLKSLIFVLKKTCIENNISVVDNLNECYSFKSFITNKGLNWWFPKLIDSLHALFSFGRVEINSVPITNPSSNANDAGSVCFNFISNTHNGWINKFIDNFQSTTSLILQLQVILSKMRQLNFDLNLKQNDILQVQLTIPSISFST